MPAGVCQRAVLMQDHGWIGREWRRKARVVGPTAQRCQWDQRITRWRIQEESDGDAEAGGQPSGTPGTETLEVVLYK